MTIGQRLVVIFVLIALLPLGLMLGIGIVASKSLLEETAGRNFALVAIEKANAIDTILDAKVHEARELARHPVIQNAVIQANASYGARTPMEISGVMQEIDKKWIEMRAQCTQAQQILHNDVSTFLIKRFKTQPKGYGEIFLTDQYGATIGMTKVLSDYDQSDEEWWQAGYSGGQGDVFIDDRGFDETVQSITAGIVVPIERDGRVLGVLKINFRLDDIVEIISGKDLGEGEGVFLARSLGSLVITSHGWNDGIVFEDVLRHADAQGMPGWSDNRHGENDTVIGFAPVKTAIYARVLTPEARPGISGEHWRPVHWFVFVETELTPASSSINKLIWIFALTGALALIIVTGIALFTAQSLSRPVRALQKGAEDIASGNISRRVGTDEKDEIGQLSRSIDVMLDRINTLTASRDDLNNEIYVRKLAEQALDAARAEAEAANQAKSRFLANVSHDLRTPLNAIMGFSEMMREQMFGPLGHDRYREYAGDILQSGRFLIKLINDILDLSKIEAGKYILQDENIDVSQLVEASMKQVSTQAQNTDITLVQEIDDALPHLFGDDRAVTQILHNLLSNAIKFTPSGGQVTVSASFSVDNEIELNVRDTGIGMMGEEIENALKPFVQTDSNTTRHHQGTGLGLSLAKNFAELHGGTLIIESTKGIGTTVHVRFPADRSLTLN